MSHGRTVAHAVKPAAKEEGGERLWQAVRAGLSVVYDWDLAAGRIAWSDDLAALFASPRDVAFMPAHGLTDVIVPEDCKTRAASLAQAGVHSPPFECDYRIQGASGPFWVNEHARVEFDGKGRPRRLIGVLQAITERKERESLLERTAHYDELTGHFTRARLRELVRLAMRERGSGYLTLSIDHASQLLESFGHAAADAVVQEVGRRIARSVRGNDAVGRIAPYQFGVLLTQGGKRELKALGERLLGAVRGSVIKAPTGPIAVTLSAGGVGLREAADADAVFTLGEEALAEAKRAGCDRYIPYAQAQGRSEQRARNCGIAEMVLAALEEERLRLAFQPVVEARSGRIAQYEALIRLIGTDGQVVAAAQFMPAVERLGLARLIDRRTLDLAMVELVQSPDLRLAVNVSALTAADAAWLQALEKLLAGAPTAAHRLTIEITETAALDSFHTTEHFVAALRALGCAVALDDFGAGHTSFRHLRGLAVNIVKIDGAFIGDLAQRPDNRLVVRAVRDLAEGLGLATVAEGVETADDARILAEMGVDFLQGYHLGRPGFERPWRQPVPLRLVAAS